MSQLSISIVIFSSRLYDQERGVNQKQRGEACLTGED